MSIFIYTLYSQNVKKSIFDNLRQTSNITALFYLEEDELNKEEFAKVRDEFDKFAINSDYQIYDESNNISYGVDSLYTNSDILNKIRERRSLPFEEKDFLCYGIFYEDNQGDFVIVTRERKEVFNNQLNMLLSILGISLLLGLTSILFLSKWIADMAYRPFRKVIKEVNNISTNNLDVQIELPDTEDELQDLIVTFNHLLSKISDTVSIQKNFVRYVSHEFKTPLTSMLGNLEVFSLKERNPQEYHKMAQKMIEQIYQLENIINTLIVISDLQKDKNISDEIRIDELIWEITDRLSERYTNSKIKMDIDISPQDEALLSMTKDKTQLLMAFFNLIENAVKYSNGKTVNIRLYKQNKSLHLQVKDYGIGIPQEQLTKINKPFYRADNTDQIEGSGIGLSIALRILDKNGIRYEINSKVNKGTLITLIF